MIGRAEWFTRRKYTGWGLSPATWQGYAYIATGAGIAFLVSLLPLDVTGKMIAIGIWAALILADVLHIFSTMKLDERETKIEAIAERNASWTMVTALALVIVYLAYSKPELVEVVMPLVAIPIAAGLTVKALSNFILRDKDL